MIRREPVQPNASDWRAYSWVAYAAAASALGYSAMKVYMAAKGQIGLPGFPASAAETATHDHPAADQLGNAALGVVSAALALATVQRWGRIVPRWILLLALTSASALEGVGAAVLVARVLRLTSGFGKLPAGPGPYLGAAYAAGSAALLLGTTWVFWRDRRRAAK